MQHYTNLPRSKFSLKSVCNSPFCNIVSAWTPAFCKYTNSQSISSYEHWKNWKSYHRNWNAINTKEVKNTRGRNLPEGNADFPREKGLPFTGSLFTFQLDFGLASVTASLGERLSLILEVILYRAFCTHLYSPVICTKPLLCINLTRRH